MPNISFTKHNYRSCTCVPLVDFILYLQPVILGFTGRELNYIPLVLSFVTSNCSFPLLNYYPFISVDHAIVFLE